MNLSLEQIAILVAMTDKVAKPIAAMYTMSYLSGFASAADGNIPAILSYIDGLVSLGLVSRDGMTLYQITEKGAKVLARAEIMLSELHSAVQGSLNRRKFGGRPL